VIAEYEDGAMPLELYNTLTRSKEVFEPLQPGKVRMYNCGPTVYSFAHIGNFASFLLADLLRRYLEYSGYEVMQVMNITDVGHLTDDDAADAQGEDKLEKKAREEKKDPWEIARFYEQTFHEDRRRLNVRDAHVYPRATEHIPEMVAMIEELLDQGLAYEVEGQVYFSIDRFPRYGVLSGNTTQELLAGHRVEVDPQKRNPLDFTLWKKDPRHIMQWVSPWGRGFPGWHIECSAMSRKYLGEVFDIHTGGEDNIFPHHECEIAQSSGGVDRIFARYWIHRRHILVDKKKMAKSAGNFYAIRDLIAKGYQGAEIRYLILSAHYRSQLNFTFEGLAAGREALRKLREFEANALSLPERAGEAVAVEKVRDLAAAADARFRSALDDDLNVSEALAQVHGFVSEAYRAMVGRSSGSTAVAQLRRWDEVLGVLSVGTGSQTAGKPEDPSEGLSEAEVERLLRERDAARVARDFREADRIRDFLRARGIAIKDSPEGTRWHRQV
jgi:cysteinyl-tRNA synthetase